MINDRQDASLLGGLGRFQTAEEYAYRHLRHMILSGRLTGGTRINQDEIARDLQLSRMPVRQAILRLEGDGLVVNRPNRGATVTTLGPEAALELFEMRGVLEGLAISVAIAHIDAAALREIEARIGELEGLQTDPGLWLERHDELHDFLCGFAGRPRLRANLRHIRHSVAPYQRIYLSTNRQAELSGFEHRALLEVIRAGDAGAAERMMREHVMSAAQAFVDFLRTYDEKRGQGLAADQS